MFNKSYEEGKVVYRSKELPLPDLIRGEQLTQVLTSLGYDVMGEKEERSGPVKSTDFLCSYTAHTLRARNRGWETQIDVEQKWHSSPQHWMMEVKGNPKKEDEVKKIVDSLETETYREAKKLAESSGEGIAWKELPIWYGNLLLEERIRGK